MTERMRIDRLLVERGLFESRARARAAIEAGLVTANEKPVSKGTERFDDSPVELVDRKMGLHDPGN